MFKSFFSHLDTSNPTFAELIKKMYTKPIELMKDLIKLIPNNNEFVILDFFAGTGSTGHSVLKLNEEDGGKRQFILCTLENDDETNIGIDLCYERLTRIMQGKNANGKDVKDSIDYFTKHTSNKPFGGSLDVYRLKSLDCSLLTKSKIYDEINEENYEMKFKNKQEKIN
jgi:adenine-specific DNA-methyltransferase